MKYILVFLMTCASAANAASVRVDPNRIQLSENPDCVGVAISSGTAHPIFLAASGYSFVSVESEHATANVFCAPRSNVTISGANRGKKVRPDQSVLFYLAPLLSPFYCISDLAGGASNAMICRGK